MHGPRLYSTKQKYGSPYLNMNNQTEPRSKSVVGHPLITKIIEQSNCNNDLPNAIEINHFSYFETEFNEAKCAL